MLSLFVTIALGIARAPSNLIPNSRATKLSNPNSKPILPLIYIYVRVPIQTFAHRLHALLSPKRSLPAFESSIRREIYPGKQSSLTLCQIDPVL